MRFFRYLIKNYQQRYLSIRDVYKRKRTLSFLLMISYNLEFLVIILQIEQSQHIGQWMMKLLFYLCILLQLGLLIAIFFQLSPFKYKVKQGSQQIRPILEQAHDYKHKNVKNILYIGISFTLKTYIYIFSQLTSWILTYIIRYVLNLTNLSSLDTFYMSISTIFLMGNFLIAFLISSLEFDLTFKNSDYLGTLFINDLSRDVVIRLVVITVSTALQNSKISYILGIAYYFVSSILSFWIKTYSQEFIELLQVFCKLLFGLLLLQHYLQIGQSQNIHLIIMIAPILMKILMKLQKQNEKFLINKKGLMDDQQLRQFYKQITQYFLKKNEKYNKGRCKQKLSLNIYCQITNHLLNCDKRQNQQNACFCVQYFPILINNKRNWNRYLEFDEDEYSTKIIKLVNDKKQLKQFLVQLLSSLYLRLLQEQPIQQFSQFYFLIQVLKRALKVFQNCQIMKDKVTQLKQRLIINELFDFSTVKLQKQNKKIQEETSNMMIFYFQDSLQIMQANLKQLFNQLQEFYQMLIDPIYDQEQLSKLGEKIINNKIIFQKQLKETLKINPYDQNLQVLINLYHKYVESQLQSNDVQQFFQHKQIYSNKLFGIDSYVVVITLLNQIGSIINYTKNFCNLIDENKNLKGQNINQYMPDVIAKQHNLYLQKYLDGGSSNLIGQEQTYLLLKDAQQFIIPIIIQIRIEYNIISQLGASALIQKASNFDNHLILINQFGVVQGLNQNTFQLFNQHSKLEVHQIQNINILMIIPGIFKTLKILNQQSTSVEIQRPEEITLIFPTDSEYIQALKMISIHTENRNPIKYLEEQKKYILSYLNQLRQAKIYNAKIMVYPLKLVSQKLFICEITNIYIQEINDLQRKLKSIQSLSFASNNNVQKQKDIIYAQIQSLKHLEQGNLEANVINQEEIMTKNIRFNMQNYSNPNFQLISNRTLVNSEQNLLSENIYSSRLASQQNYFMGDGEGKKEIYDQNESIQFSNGHQLEIMSQTLSKSDYNFKEKLEIAINVLFQNYSSYQFNIFRIFYAIAYLSLLTINLIIFYQTITQYRFQWINESEDILLKKTGNSINIFLLEKFQDKLELYDDQLLLLHNINQFIQYFSDIQIMMEWKTEESQQTFLYTLIDIYEHLIQQNEIQDEKLLLSVKSQYIDICNQINELYEILEDRINEKIIDYKQMQIFLTILGYFLTTLTIISLIPVGIHISNGRDKIFQLINTFQIKDLYRQLYRFDQLQKLLDQENIISYNSQFDQSMNNTVNDKIQRLHPSRNKYTESKRIFWNQNIQKLAIMVILFSLSQLYLMITLIYQNSFFLIYEHNILKAQRILELKHGMSTCSAIISMIRIDDEMDELNFLMDSLDLMKEEFEEQQGWKSIILEIDLGKNVSSSLHDNFCHIFESDTQQIFNFSQCQTDGVIDDGLIQLLTRYFGQITEIFDYLDNDSDFQIKEYLISDQITLIQQQQIFIQHGLTILYNLQLNDLQQYSQQYKLTQILLFVMSFCIFVIIMIIINRFIITYLVNLTYRARRLFTLIPMKLIVENAYVMNYVQNEGKYIIK